jgi:hypothetical protein
VTLFRVFARLFLITAFAYIGWRALRTLGMGSVLVATLPFWMAEFSALLLGCVFVMGLWWMIERPHRCVLRRSLGRAELPSQRAGGPPQAAQGPGAALPAGWRSTQAPALPAAEPTCPRPPQGAVRDGFGEGLPGSGRYGRLLQRAHRGGLPLHATWDPCIPLRRLPPAAALLRRRRRRAWAPRRARPGPAATLHARVRAWALRLPSCTGH